MGETKRLVTICVASLSAMTADAAGASSLYFSANEPRQYDFADLARLPKEFGVGEFSFELWVKPDHRYPVGNTSDRGTIAQLTDWSDETRAPYSHPVWWHEGNWLLDGHTRPHGRMSPNDSREGTFSLQFYAGGRLRWTFSDSGENRPNGSVYAVQAEDAAATPSLLDGNWHHVVAVRRWRQPSGATLELWIDGKQVAQTQIPLRVNMRQFWDKLPHPDNPDWVGGWSLGAEVMTAWDYYFTQYEDYKGSIDELRLWSRALSPQEIATAATGVSDEKKNGLRARFKFEEGKGGSTCDSIDRTLCMTLHKTTRKTWSAENAPLLFTK